MHPLVFVVYVPQLFRAIPIDRNGQRSFSPEVNAHTRFLLERGYCCESGCRHCPYGYRKDERSDVPLEKNDEC